MIFQINYRYILIIITNIITIYYFIEITFKITFCYYFVKYWRHDKNQLKRDRKIKLHL